MIFQFSFFFELNCLKIQFFFTSGCKVRVKALTVKNSSSRLLSSSNYQPTYVVSVRKALCSKLPRMELLWTHFFKKSQKRFFKRYQDGTDAGGFAISFSTNPFYFKSFGFAPPELFFKKVLNLDGFCSKYPTVILKDYFLLN